MTQFSETAQFVLGFLASALILIAFIPYARAVALKTITPRPLTWIGWTLLMGASFISQVDEKGFAINQVVMCMSIIGCLTISIMSIKNGNIKKIDWVCLSLGLACTVIYVITKDAWLTTGFAIVADFIVAIPTISNAWNDPAAERSIAWKYGAAGYIITVVACKGHDTIYVVYPLFLLCFNTLMIVLTNREKPLKVKA